MISKLSHLLMSPSGHCMAHITWFVYGIISMEITLGNSMLTTLPWCHHKFQWFVPTLWLYASTCFGTWCDLILSCLWQDTINLWNIQNKFVRCCMVDYYNISLWSMCYALQYIREFIYHMIDHDIYIYIYIYIYLFLCLYFKYYGPGVWNKRYYIMIYYYYII